MDNLPAASTMPPALPYAFAKRHGLVLNGYQENQAMVSCLQAPSLALRCELQRYLACPLVIQLIDEAELSRLLEQQHHHASTDAMQLAEDMGDANDLFDMAEALPKTADLLETEDDAPIIRLLNILFTEAIKQNASDIHVETFETRMVIRFRVDGELREVIQPQRTLAPLIVSRIKVMAKLDIAEKRLPQDGRIALKIAGRNVDVRVSTIPASHGERVVMRLLDKKAAKLDLTHLGMAASTLKQLRELIDKPHGIILVTGPTGSGKTTSLYAALTELNQAKRNILTVEDPIEYDLPGIGQTQVNSKVNMTFAKGLRAILRQDPDIVMVGEIRDLETAEIAVQASLTGHLVLSTLHTNTAIGAITRLQDMGVEPFLLASSLIGVAAQRLVRLICPDCKQLLPASREECELLNLPPAAAAPLIAHPQGCEHCNHSGYSGRSGIYELIGINDDLRTLIHSQASEQTMEQHCRQYYPSIRQDGIRRILAHETTLAEVLRVTNA